MAERTCIDMRIFLSYGHDEYAVVAAQLKRDLEASGHEVWFDVDRLRPGGDWEQYIENGLDWASAVEGGRFLAVMTPHSVRRPNGYCLNELARAFNRNLRIYEGTTTYLFKPFRRMHWAESQAIVDAGEVIANFRQPFDLLAETTAAGAHQKAGDITNPPKSEIWLMKQE